MPIGSQIRGMPSGVASAIKGFSDATRGSNLTATGNSQATALPLPTDGNVFTTVASGSGAILPWGMDQVPTPNAAIAGSLTGAQALTGIVEFGDSIRVINAGANALLVYPQLGGKVQAGAANAGFSIPTNKPAVIFYIGGGNWSVNLSA